MVIDRLERQREYGELRCEKLIIEYFRSDRFLSVAKETHRRCPTSSIGSVRRGCVFASNFPHEIAMEDALHEINEFFASTAASVGRP